MSWASSSDLLNKQLRLLLETQGREVADMVKNKLPAGTGFALFVFDFGDKGNLAWYVSNAERPDVTKTIIEWAEKNGIDATARSARAWNAFAEKFDAIAVKAEGKPESYNEALNDVATALEHTLREVPPHGRGGA